MPERNHVSEQVTIYVYLPDEAVDTWRPVISKRIGPNLFRIEDSVPEDEQWEFHPGQTVRVRERCLSGAWNVQSVQLVAFEVAAE
jgi:hypothetical protein